jgi:hypothetical protein
MNIKMANDLFKFDRPEVDSPTEEMKQMAAPFVFGIADGLTEIKKMEHLMGKAPCLARMNELAAWAAKDEEDYGF